MILSKKNKCNLNNIPFVVECFVVINVRRNIVENVETVVIYGLMFWFDHMGSV